MIHIDLHTHSYASPDGGLRLEQYRSMLASGVLDYIAVTDHNTIAAALSLHAQLGEHIVVGEEISTREGDVIGLYLTESIPAGLSAQETAARIHAQGGLVYVPHPFEKVRKGVGAHVLTSLEEEIDILETYNGRAFGQHGNRLAQAWSATHDIVTAASSDAHGWHGWGRTYTTLVTAPTQHTLCTLLVQATMVVGHPSVRGILYPKANRLRTRLHLARPDDQARH